MQENSQKFMYGIRAAELNMPTWKSGLELKMKNYIM